MNYFQRRRYTVRYGSRRKVSGWLVLALAIGTGAAAFTYEHHHDHPAGPRTYIITSSSTKNEPGAVLSGSMLQRLRSAGQDSDKAYADVVSPGVPQPDVLPLTPFLPNGQVDWGPTRDSTLGGNVAAVQRAVERQAAQGPFDLLSTIIAATKAAPPPATLIVVSSGVSTAGGLDLRRVGWAASPRSVAGQLKTRGLLPDLAGYQVWFSGLGDTAGRQAPLPQPQQTTLARYWLAICHASRASSCHIDQTARREPPSHSVIPVPVVPVPKVTSVQGPPGSPPGTRATSLPDPLLFAFGSARLIPSADTILQPIAHRARRHHLLVSIIGTASPDGGTSSYNHHLSVRRADAVRARLISLGLPLDQIIHVTGVGTEGRSLHACLIHGHLDEAICRHMRRVVIVTSPAAVSP